MRAGLCRKLFVDPGECHQGLGAAGDTCRRGLRRAGKFVPDRKHGVVGVLAPGIGQGAERGVELLDMRERLQGVVPRGEEALADGFVLEYEILPGAAFEIDGALGQLLHARVEGDCRCAAFAAVAGELLERHPAADGRCAQYAGDDEKACQKGQAE